MPRDTDPLSFFSDFDIEVHVCGFNMYWLYWAEAEVSGWVPVLFAGVFLVMSLPQQEVFVKQDKASEQK